MSVPREVVEAWWEKYRLLLGYAPEADKLQTFICGSMRRGKPTVKDVDLVIEGWSMIHFETVVEAINKSVFDGAAAQAAMSFPLTKIQPYTVVTKLSGGYKYHQYEVQFDNRWVFKLDVYRAEKEYLGAMMLHCTGDAKFNAVMRGRAKGMGYKLNQYGLWLTEQKKTVVSSVAEALIFNALKMNYVPPEKRNGPFAVKNAALEYKLLACQTTFIIEDIDGITYDVVDGGTY